jgi:hypothetical protein
MHIYRYLEVIPLLYISFFFLATQDFSHKDVLVLQISRTEIATDLFVIDVAKICIFDN